MDFLETSNDQLSDWDASGLDVDLNAFEIGAAVGAAGIAVAALGVTTMAAPTMVAVPGTVAAGLALAGYNQRHGHLPFMGKGDQLQVTVTKTPAQPTSGEVVDRSGEEVAPASL